MLMAFGDETFGFEVVGSGRLCPHEWIDLLLTDKWLLAERLLSKQSLWQTCSVLPWDVLHGAVQFPAAASTRLNFLPSRTKS